MINYQNNTFVPSKNFNAGLLVTEHFHCNIATFAEVKALCASSTTAPNLNPNPTVH